MNPTSHLLNELFAQLGLASQASEVQGFLAAHRPLAGDVLLSKAPFWTPTQAAFLSEETLRDADWAPVIDELNVALREVDSIAS